MLSVVVHFLSGFFSLWVGLPPRHHGCNLYPMELGGELVVHCKLVRHSCTRIDKVWLSTLGANIGPAVLGGRMFNYCHQHAHPPTHTHTRTRTPTPTPTHTPLPKSLLEPSLLRCSQTRTRCCGRPRDSDCSALTNSFWVI